jgi:hypothetical protein
MDGFAQSDKFSIRTVTGSWQMDWQDLPQRARLRRHDDNPVCKIYRFLDVVRDQHCDMPPESW